MKELPLIPENWIMMLHPYPVQHRFTFTRENKYKQFTTVENLNMHTGTLQFRYPNDEVMYSRTTLVLHPMVQGTVNT
jgi:hypothetical protein